MALHHISQDQVLDSSTFRTGSGSKMSPTVGCGDRNTSAANSVQSTMNIRNIPTGQRPRSSIYQIQSERMLYQITCAWISPAQFTVQLGTNLLYNIYTIYNCIYNCTLQPLLFIRVYRYKLWGCALCMWQSCNSFTASVYKNNITHTWLWFLKSVSPHIFWSGA